MILLLPPLINDNGTCFLSIRNLTWLHQSGIWLDVQIALESGLLSPKRLTLYHCFISENGCFEKHPPTQDNHKTRFPSQCGPFAVILRHQPTFCLAFRAVKFGRLFFLDIRKKRILIFRALHLPAERSRNSMRL